MNQGAHFTMDFVEEHYRDSVKMIMEILCVDIKTAYDLFMMSGCNVEAAIHLHTNPQPQHFMSPTVYDNSTPRNQRNRRNGVIHNNNFDEFHHQIQQFQHIAGSDYDDQQELDQFDTLPKARRRPVPLRVDQQSQFDAKFNQFLQFKRKRKSFAKNYKIRRQSTTQSSMSISRKIFNKKANKPAPKQLLQLHPYINQVEDQLLQRRCHINFGKGSMSQSMEFSFDKKKPFLVFHLNFGLKKNDEEKEGGSKKSIDQNNVTRNDRRKKKMVIELSSDDNEDKKESKSVSSSLQQISSFQPNTRTRRGVKNKQQQKIQQQKLNTRKQQKSNNSLEQLKQQKVTNYNNEESDKNKKNEFFKKLLMDTRLVRLVNEQFENYIMDCESYQYENYLRRYFSQEEAKSKNYLLVLRVNVMEEIEEVGRVDLDLLMMGQSIGTQKVQQQNKKTLQSQQQQQQQHHHQFILKVRQQLKKIIQRIGSIKKQELQIHERYRLLQMGIDHFEYVKPPSTAEKIKIKEDQELIKQQQQEFLNMQNDMLEQQMKEIENESKQQQQLNKKSSREEVMKKRQQIREKMNKYDDSNDSSEIMTVKFRLPNGKNIMLRVSIHEKVCYLFEYVYSLEMENIGFEEEEQEGGYCERNFDLIRTEDRLSLKDKKELLLNQVFEGSLMEALNVKEE